MAGAGDDEEVGDGFDVEAHVSGFGFLFEAREGVAGGSVGEVFFAAELGVGKPEEALHAARVGVACRLGLVQVGKRQTRLLQLHEHSSGPELIGAPVTAHGDDGAGRLEDGLEV